MAISDEMLQQIEKEIHEREKAKRRAWYKDRPQEQKLKYRVNSAVNLLEKHGEEYGVKVVIVREV